MTRTAARCGQGLVHPGAASQLFHQDPRHQGRPARRRGSDLCRRAGQRDLPVLARALPGGGRGLSCAASSGASQPGSSPMSAPSPHCLSAAGTLQSRAGCRTRCATNSASPSPGGPTRPAANWCVRRAGSAHTMPVPGRSASCGPERKPRIQRPRTFFTSRPWLRHLQ